MWSQPLICPASVWSQCKSSVFFFPPASIRIIILNSIYVVCTHVWEQYVWHTGQRTMFQISSLLPCLWGRVFLPSLFSLLLAYSVSAFHLRAGGLGLLRFSSTPSLEVVYEDWTQAFSPSGKRFYPQGLLPMSEHRVWCII